MSVRLLTPKSRAGILKDPKSANENLKARMRDDIAAHSSEKPQHFVPIRNNKYHPPSTDASSRRVHPLEPELSHNNNLILRLCLVRL